MQLTSSNTAANGRPRESWCGPHDDAGRRGLIGNIVFGGLIGAAIDSGSGAAFSHPVNPLVIELTPD